MYETNEDERNRIRKTLKENKSADEEEMSESKRSQIRYYENCLIRDRIPFAEIRAAFDTAAENVFGTFINQLERTIENRQSFVLHELCRKKVLISNKKKREKQFFRL